LSSSSLKFRIWNKGGKGGDTENGLKNFCGGQALVVHTYNPNFSAGRDQKDQNQSRELVCKTLSQKKPFTKKVW
jgi:hypothetical protein